MNWLFIHQNFPGQYLHVVRHLVGAGDRIVGIGQQHSAELPGVERIEYVPGPAVSAPGQHVHDFETAVQNGLAVARCCEQLKAGGFFPAIVIGHNGWGETLYVKDVWPNIPLLNYFEFFYRATGSDIDFDPEFVADPDIALRLRTRNAVNLLGLDAGDWGQTPTRWQRDQYPQRDRDRISVIHEGVDTGFVRPDPTARLWLRGGASFARGDEIVTYSARNLEPYRGFHVFMRALPKILHHRPKAHVLIVGGDGVSYGPRPVPGGGWRQQLLDEVGGELDLPRVHFLGRLGFRQYLSVLQLSAVHVYLTYPFVLSWSLIEALSAGCPVVASRTPPVEEIISDGENGWLVDFFDIDGLADRVADVLEGTDAHRRMRAAARASAVGRYDLRTVCLPAYLSLLQRLTGQRLPTAPAATPGG
jgi:glycosyltransferase involved in cell wall biosynthesis